MTAASLGAELGLEVSDAGASTLLRGEGYSARIFPGKELLLLNGRSVSMSEPARRDGASVLVPVSGVEAIRRGRAASRLAPIQLPPVVAFQPAPVRSPKAVPSAAGAPKGAGEAAWVPNPGAETRPWNWIVVHHSDDVCGCCSKYDAAHRAKGWDECGYHFVIGNGSMTSDGQVEVTTRWPVQKHGAHAKTPDNRFNDFGIGIVLVGDFERGPGPSAVQYAALLRLTRWLMARYGVTPDRVVRHSDAKATQCPGKNFPWARFQGDLVSFAAVTEDKDVRGASLPPGAGVRADAEVAAR